jgi:nicotinamide mononucleotide transporter
MTPLEIAANAFATASIWLAARNNIHLWWTGIVGCALFCVLFLQTQLYADATLQVFFIGACVWGWWTWRRGEQGQALPVRHTSPRSVLLLGLAALGVTAAYGSLLKHWTDAYAPFVDSAVLGFSVVAQLLLMQRRIETWPAWLIVNSLSVPLFWSRGLTLTAVLYAVYWCNAWYGWWHWRRQERTRAPATPAASA